MAGEPDLVLLPGLLCDAALWQFQLSALAEFARPVVPDLTRFNSIAALAAGVLAEAPPRFALAGLSMGGYVALEIMRQVPERVTRLALVDTQARPDSPEARARRTALIALAERGKFRGVTPRLLPLLLHRDNREGPLAQIVMDMAERIGRAAFLRQQKAILDRIDSRPGLGRIAVPTIVVCGQEDVLTPPELTVEMASAIPGAQEFLIPGAGHLAPLEQPEAVNRVLIDWLQDTF